MRARRRALGWPHSPLGLGSSELDDYERLLEAQDRDIFSWLTFEAKIPHQYDTPVLWKIRAFHSHAGPIHT
jgi:antitoxin CptB